MSFTAAPSVGHVLVIALWNNGQSTGAANTYTAPAGWTRVDQNVAEPYLTYQTFTHVVTTAESNKYVFTPAAAQREHVWIAADVAGASGVDSARNAFINNSTVFTTPALTPSVASELAIAFNLPDTLAAVTWTNPAGWTKGAGPTAPWSGEALDEALSTTSPISESATLSAAATGFAAMVLLKPSGVQATPTPTPTPVPTATPTPVGSPASVAQWSTGSAYAPASISLSFPSAPAPGDVVIAAFWNNGQNGGAANTYTPASGWTSIDLDSSALYATYQAFWHVVTAGENNAYVFTPAAAQREHVWMAADVTHAGGIDRAADAFINNSTAFTTPSVAPSQSNDLALAFNMPLTQSTVTWTNPAGWTVGTGSFPPWSGEALYQRLSSTSAVSAKSTLSASSVGFAGIVLVSPSGVAASPTPMPPSTVDWTTMGYDIERTGYNPTEKTLGTGSFATLHSMWSVNVGSEEVAEPLVAMNVTVSGVNHNLVYGGGQSGVLYALDADTGTKVWSKQLGSSSYTCGSSSPATFGIEGTGVIDRPHNRIYVPDGQNQVHALDLATGAEASGWPVSVAAVNGHDFIYAGLTYNPANGYLYAETSSSCDISPWFGRIEAINTATAAVIGTFYPTQGSSGGSIWGVGGASIDPATNNVFIATGNADGSPQNSNYAEQIVELSADVGTVIAHNAPTLPNSADADFGATPLLFQPNGCPALAAVVNKSGAFLLYNRSNISAGPTQTILMSIATDTGDFIGVPSYDPVTNYVYVGLPSTFGIYKPGAAAFSIRADCTLNPTPVWNAVFGPDGAVQTTSDTPRSAITIANGVAYVSDYSGDTTYAFNAATGALLWSASLGDYGFAGPVVVNGRLYVVNLGGTLHAWTP